MHFSIMDQLNEKVTFFWDPYTMLILFSKDSDNNPYFNQQCRLREHIGCNSKLGVVKISKLKLFAGFAYRSSYKLQ